MKQRMIGILLTLCMVLALLPTAAGASNMLCSGTCGEQATWILTDDGDLTIRGTGVVTALEPYEDIREHIRHIRRIVILEGITQIDDWAFSRNAGYSPVEYPEEVLILPDSLKVIGVDAFEGHYALKEIRFGKNLTHIYGNAFFENRNLESVTLPDSLQYLGSHAFYGCRSLKHIEVPGGITELDGAVFASCTALESVVLGDGIRSIGSQAFEGCTSLTDIRIPGTITEIQYGAFQDCSALARVSLPPLERLATYAFRNCTQLKEVRLADGTKAICTGAFTNCTGLETVNLPDSVTLIEQGAFSNCYALKSIRLPAQLSVIPEDLFSECCALEALTMPGSVTRIERNAFLGCIGLRTICYAGTVQQLQATRIVPGGNGALENADIYLIPAMPDPVFGLYDMPEPDNWAYPGVAFCLASGLMNGVGGGYFQPDGTTTRAQLVTILWRMMGEPKATKPAPFTDLTQDWYREAVAWAAENGITTGTSATAFSPDAPVTREQMVTIFYRMCRDYLELDVSPAASLAGFPDSASVSPWAQDALQWGVAVKLINGVAVGGSAYLQPQGSATRAQIATVMRNFSNAFAGDTGA